MKMNLISFLYPWNSRWLMWSRSQKEAWVKIQGPVKSKNVSPSKAIEGDINIAKQFININTLLIQLPEWETLFEGEGWDYFSWWHHFQGGGKYVRLSDPELSNFLQCTGEGQRNFLYLHSRGWDSRQPFSKALPEGPLGTTRELEFFSWTFSAETAGLPRPRLCFVPVESCLWGFPVCFQEYKANFLFITVLSHRLIIRIFPSLKILIFCVVLLWQRSTA